jgi:uncharacterized protein
MVQDRTARNKSWRKRLVLLLGLLVVLFLVLRWLEKRLVYFPTADLVATGRELPTPLEEASFAAADGVRLHAWFFAAPTNSPRARWAILLCHGNGGNISHRLSLYRALIELGVNVLAFDYRGYGRSEGRPDEEGTYRDAVAACRWLNQKGFSPDRIIAYGESLGGGVAAELARRESIGGLVLQSTFTSIPSLGSELYPWLPVRWISSIRYDTQRKLPAIKCPVLVLHSRADRMIGFHHAEANFAAAHSPKMFQEVSGDHNEVLEANRPQFLNALETYLTTYFR